MLWKPQKKGLKKRYFAAIRLDKTVKHWKHASGTIESETQTIKHSSLIINQNIWILLEIIRKETQQSYLKPKKIPKNALKC